MNKNTTNQIGWKLHHARTLLSLAVLMAGTGSLHADGDNAAPAGSDAQQTAYRSSLAQGTVREQVGSIRNDLLQSIAELKLNDLGAGDTASLNEASNRLAGLSQDEMQQIITALQNAGVEPEEQKRRDFFAGAYQGQQEVALKLKTLAAQLSAEEAQNELPSQLQLLIARQSANIRQTSVLSNAGVALPQLNPTQKNLHTVVGAEQTAIGGEIDVLYKAVASAANGPTDDPATPIAKTASDAMTGSMLQTVVPLALQLTQSGPFTDAVTKQTDVRNYLVGVMVALVSQEDTATRLYQLRSQLDQAQDDEKDLAHTAAATKLDGATLAERQNRIADFAYVTQTLLQSLNPAAASRMTEARKDMDQSAAALQSAPDPKTTAPQQQQVVQALDDVSKLLDQQIAAMESEEEMSPDDQATDLQNLLDKLNQVQQTDKSDPASGAKDLGKIQQNQPGDLTPDVADDISKAAEKLGGKQPDPDGANENLTDATTKLRKQLADLDQEAQDYKALEDLDKKLADAETGATEADNQLQTGQDGKMTQVASGLTKAQSTLDGAKQSAPADVPGAAKEDIQKASDSLKDATLNAVQGKGGPADASAQKGIAAIKQAREALGQAMAAMRGNASGSQRGFASAHGHGSLHSPRSIHEGQIAGVATAGGSPAQVLGALQPKDRDALKQYEAEKVVPDYAPQVEQYLKNLGDDKDTP